MMTETLLIESDPSYKVAPKILARYEDFGCPNCWLNCWLWSLHVRVFLNDGNYYNLHDDDELIIRDNVKKIVCLECGQELF